MRIVDLFCGIGGVAEAARGLDGVEVTSAMDIDRNAISVYAANHNITPRCVTLESIRHIPVADLWWLSPPCQPYTERGLGRQERDRRSQALQHLIELIQCDRPEMVVLENVPAFAFSRHHQWLSAVLADAGYRVRSDVLCPTQWGVPMRRNRFYLRARRDGCPISAVGVEGVTKRSLAEYLDESNWSDAQLQPPPQQTERYGRAMDVVDAGERHATAACFTSAYGRSPIRSGSYVRCPQRGVVRRFSATEIGRLMGFNDAFQMPEPLGHRARYRLLGNSLSVTVVRALLRSMTSSRS